MLLTLTLGPFQHYYSCGAVLEHRVYVSNSYRRFSVQITSMYVHSIIHIGHSGGRGGWMDG